MAGWSKLRGGQYSLVQRIPIELKTLLLWEFGTESAMAPGTLYQKEFRVSVKFSKRYDENTMPVGPNSGEAQYSLVQRIPIELKTLLL